MRRVADLRVGFVVFGLALAQACGGLSTRFEAGGGNAPGDGGATAVGAGGSQSLPSAGGVGGAGGSQVGTAAGGMLGSATGASGGAGPTISGGGASGTAATGGTAVSTTWTAGSAPFGGFSGVGGGGSAGFPVYGTGAFGANGAFAGDGGGANILDTCARYCTDYAARCADDAAIRTCYLSCTPLASDFPVCDQEFESQLDCLLANAPPAGDCSSDCSLTGACPSWTAACPAPDINVCSQACDSSKTVLPDSCTYFQTCREGTHETYCERTFTTQWDCTCFGTQGQFTGQGIVHTTDDDACAHADCPATVPY